MTSWGSSPRGRGKRQRNVQTVDVHRLIPAWAGKTRRRAGGGPGGWAHPRVGGENWSLPRLPCRLLGSSPRGRGKRDGDGAGPPARRLIPAWAGKTSRPRHTPKCSAAHPRVGGENDEALLPITWSTGSSPRGRGKLRAPRHDERVTVAHPRVGGENFFRVDRLTGGAGSSPRGRGKRPVHIDCRVPGGLIPAWAGKTSASPGPSRWPPAHPRVGGENDP